MVVRYRLGFIALLAIWFCAVLPSCNKDRKSYEAEIKELCFVKYQGKDTTVRLSTDTVRPQSTEVQVQVVSGTDLTKIIPRFTLSAGATADKVAGEEYDASDGFDITVTSENGKVQRTYHFDVTVLADLDWGGGRGTDSVFLNGDAYIENVRLEGFPDLAPRQVGKRIYFEVPEGTDITNLAPTFEVAEGATAEFESGTPYDFSDPLYVRVTSQDKKASVGYTIYVRVAGPLPSSEARIWDFRFDETLAKAVMQGSAIYIAVESGLDITHLTPRYERSDGTSVDVPSGKPHDFSKPVQITVRSQDGNAKSVYTVTVEQVKSSEANLIDFRIKEIRGGVPTYMGDRSIYYYVVDKNVRTNQLTPVFTVSKGATLVVKGGDKLVSGSSFDLTEVSQLVVTSEDGASSRTYDFTLEFGKENNTGITPNLKIHAFDFMSPQCIAQPVIMEGRIVCIVPAGTQLKNLIPVFTLGEGSPVKKPKLYLAGTNTEVVSGVTELDFSQSVRLYAEYVVKGKEYEVEVRVADKEMVIGGLKSFSLEYDGGKAKGSIGNGKVYALLPPGVDVTKLRPRYEMTEGYRCDLRQAEPQDFTSPVRFKVTSPDGVVTRSYEVVVRQGRNSEAELFDLKIEGLPSPSVNGNQITFYGVPSTVDVANLVPTFSVSKGASVSIPSGVACSFRDPVKIKVTSEDGSMQQVYTIVVEQKLNNEAELLSFRFREFGDALNIAGSKIIFDPPTSVDVKRLTPIFEVSTGATTNILSGEARDFSKPVRITVTSQDGSMMKTYTVSRATQGGGLKFDFEEWRTIGSGSLAYEHPAGAWSSGNEGVKTSKSMIGRPERYPLRKTADSHSGSYAAEIVTELVNNTAVVKVRIAAGSLFLGSFNASNIMADPLSGPQFGIPYSGGLPDRLQGWYKYQPGSDNLDNDGNSLGKPDACDIYAILYSGNVITAKNVKNNPNIIAIARLKDGSAKSTWTKFDEEFVYRRQPAAGESLKFSIIMTSSVEGDTYSGAVGSRLVVDDIEVVLK